MATKIAEKQQAAGNDIVERIMRQYQKENPANAAQIRKQVPSDAATPKTGVLSPQEAAKMMQELDAKKQQEFDEFTAPPVTKAKGGQVKKYARGGGIEQRGKTRGKMC